MPRRRYRRSSSINGLAALVALPVLANQRMKATTQKEAGQRYFQALTDLQRLSESEFEDYIEFIFQKLGYQTRRRGNTNTPDHGVDIEARRDGEYVVIQCKRYAGAVTEALVRDFFGTTVSEGATKGILVTTGTFTEPGKQWAIGKHIELVGPGGIVEWQRLCKIGPYAELPSPPPQLQPSPSSNISRSGFGWWQWLVLLGLGLGACSVCSCVALAVLSAMVPPS